MSAFVFAEDRLLVALGHTRKVFAELRRKKTAAGQWEARDREIFYTQAGVGDMLVALGCATRSPDGGFETVEGLDLAALLEKTRATPASAPDGAGKNPPAPAPAPIQVRILSQYPNRHFWRTVNLATGLPLDLYEPRRPWSLSVRKVVHVEPVPGKPYFKVCRPRPA